MTTNEERLKEELGQALLNLEVAKALLQSVLFRYDSGFFKHIEYDGKSIDLLPSQINEFVMKAHLKP